MSGEDKGSSSGGNEMFNKQDPSTGSSSSQIRWIDLSEEQKRAVIRMRNTESARRSRQNRREKEAEMQQKWNENEKKIQDLEKLVDKLTDEMKHGKGKDKGSSSKSKDNKPKDK